MTEVGLSRSMNRRMGGSVNNLPRITEYTNGVTTLSIPEQKNVSQSTTLQQHTQQQQNATVTQQATTLRQNATVTQQATTLEQRATDTQFQQYDSHGSPKTSSEKSLEDIRKEHELLTLQLQIVQQEKLLLKLGINDATAETETEGNLNPSLQNFRHFDWPNDKSSSAWSNEQINAKRELKLKAKEQRRKTLFALGEQEEEVPAHLHWKRRTVPGRLSDSFSSREQFISKSVGHPVSEQKPLPTDPVTPFDKTTDSKILSLDKNPKEIGGHLGSPQTIADEVTVDLDESVFHVIPLSDDTEKNTFKTPQEIALEKENARPVWKPDDTVFSCESCCRRFTFFRRRHHCRNCGGIFCFKCVKKQPLPRLNFLKPVLVCVVCMLKIMEDNQCNNKM